MVDPVALPGRALGFGRGSERFGDGWREHGPARHFLAGTGALVLAYYAAAHVGFAFQFSGPVAAIVWLPVGVGVAFLYLCGLQFWPGVAIADLLVNNYSALPLGSAVAQSFGNLMEVVLAAALLRRVWPGRESVATLRGVIAMLLAITCATLVSATVGSLSSWLGGVIEAHSIPHVWRTWWLGDFCGALIVLPLVVSWSSLPPRPWPRVRLLEASLMTAVVAAFSAIQLGRTMMLCVLVFPALIWAALRFGSRGATLAIAIICGFAVWGATNDLGPFGVGSINLRLLDTQLFIATVSLSALAIAALVSERGDLADELRASRARLVVASDEARERIEHDLHDGAQQGLVGARIRLDAAAGVIRENPGEGQRLLEAIGRQMDGVLDELRLLARGVYPALLTDSGIVAALQSAARLTSLDVSVRGEAMTRYPQGVESAVYFCCLEALQNTAKHAGRDTRAEVRLWHHRNDLRFEVIDTGVGFDLNATSPGSGLSNMRDRIEAIGGTLTITSHKRTGTTVRGRVPIS